MNLGLVVAEPRVKGALPNEARPERKAARCNTSSPPGRSGKSARAYIESRRCPGGGKGPIWMRPAEERPRTPSHLSPPTSDVSLQRQPVRRLDREIIVPVRLQAAPEVRG